MKLNLGSGYKRLDGFVNVDFSRYCKPDYYFDMGKEVWPFDSDTVEKVVAHHILEHFGENFFHVMRELYRVCQDGAIIDILVPFPKHDSFLIDPTHRRPILPQTMAMFSKKHNQEDIANGGRETPVGIMLDVDFEVINFKYHLSPKYERMFQTLTEEQCREVVDERWNVIVETHIVMMAVK